MHTLYRQLPALCCAKLSVVVVVVVVVDDDDDDDDVVYKTFLKPGRLCKL